MSRLKIIIHRLSLICVSVDYWLLFLRAVFVKCFFFSICFRCHLCGLMKIGHITHVCSKDLLRPLFEGSSFVYTRNWSFLFCSLPSLELDWLLALSCFYPVDDVWWIVVSYLSNEEGPVCGTWIVKSVSRWWCALWQSFMQLKLPSIYKYATHTIYIYIASYLHCRWTMLCQLTDRCSERISCCVM